MKITDHNYDKYITTSQFSKLAAESVKEISTKKLTFDK